MGDAAEDTPEEIRTLLDMGEEFAGSIPEHAKADDLAEVAKTVNEIKEVTEANDSKELEEIEIVKKTTQELAAYTGDTTVRLAAIETRTAVTETNVEWLKDGQGRIENNQNVLVKKMDKLLVHHKIEKPDKPNKPNSNNNKRKAITIIGSLLIGIGAVVGPVLAFFRPK